MKSKHTPGPWVYGPEFSAVMTRDKQGTVAILLPLGHTRDDEDIDTEMMDAHGRLLAAAPELFEILDALLGFDSEASYRARTRGYQLIQELKKANK